MSVESYSSASSSLFRLSARTSAGVLSILPPMIFCIYSESAPLEL